MVASAQHEMEHRNAKAAGRIHAGNETVNGMVQQALKSTTNVVFCEHTQ